MANYKNGKSRIIAVIAIALAVVLLVGALGYFTGGFRNWDTDTWFENGDNISNNVETGGVFDENGNEMESGKLYPMSSNMTFTAVSATAAAGVTLEATITPITASNKEVDWSVEWVNPSSEWATEKAVTDYLTVTPTSDGALTATVSCAEAFGERIKIIVASRERTNIKAECIVDFCSRIGIARASIGSGSTLLDFKGMPISIDLYDLANREGLKYNPIYSTVGTTVETYTYDMQLYFNPAFRAYMESRGVSMPWVSVPGNEPSYYPLSLFIMAHGDMMLLGFFAILDSWAGEVQLSQPQITDDMLLQYISDYCDMYSPVIYDLHVLAYGQYSQIETVTPIRLKNFVTGISLSQDNIVV